MRKIVAKKILVIGAKGMLGRDMVGTLYNYYEVLPLDIEDLDITKKHSVMRFIKEVNPGMVINCAAYTNVDGCESDIDKAFSINAEGARNIAEACQKYNSKLIHFSTDYVFDGEKIEPYVENDPPNPINVYGKSKLQGERYIQEILDNYLIVRTSWLFGKNAKNFVSTILNLVKNRDELKVVNDQRGSPTYTEDLVIAVKLLIDKNINGVFNITNSGSCSWYDFAKIILKFSGNIKKVIPVRTEEFPRPAKRPKMSILDGRKFYANTEFKMPDWEDATKCYVEYFLCHNSYEEKNNNFKKERC